MSIHNSAAQAAAGAAALPSTPKTEARDGEGVMRYNTCVNGIVDVSDCTRKIRYVVKQNNNLKNIRDAIQLHHDTLVEIKKTLLGKTYKPSMLD